METETETLKRSLAALPVQIDVIDLIINPAVGAKQMREAAELGISNVFVQPVGSLSCRTPPHFTLCFLLTGHGRLCQGAGSPEILDICQEAEIAVAQGCVMMDMNQGNAGPAGKL